MDKNVNVMPSGPTPTDLEALNLILDNLEIDETEIEAIEETIESEAPDPEMAQAIEDAGPAEEVVVEELEASDASEEDVLRDLELNLERASVYEAQTSTPVDPAAVAEQKAKSTKPRPAATGAPRTPRDVNAVDAGVFVLEGDPATMDDAAKEAAKTATRALIPVQKKIAEKFDNLFTSLSVGKPPSTYVMIAFNLLDEKKSVTSADIIGAYKASGLSDGTARSQCGQIMHLFNVVKIAGRAGQTLTMNPASTIAERIRKVRS